MHRFFWLCAFVPLETTVSLYEKQAGIPTSVFDAMILLAALAAGFVAFLRQCI